MCSCPSRTDEPYEGEGFNQSPNHLAADLTTNQDLNGIANDREIRNPGARAIAGSSQALDDDQDKISDKPPAMAAAGGGASGDGMLPSIARPDGVSRDAHGKSAAVEVTPIHPGAMPPPAGSGNRQKPSSRVARLKKILLNYAHFIGPGFMISVAYIDPGNYATDIAAGASYRFKLLFIILLSNIFAILLQSLAIKLGTVTGLDLSSACRAFLPRWLNYVLYGLAEIAIIATDIAEVIGTAIALNLLIPQLPLVAGCALSILDVMAILFFYDPSGSMRGLRLFEFFVCVLVLGVVVCFCIQLSLITDTSVGEVFRGYLPSSAIVEQQGLYQACGILGATVMPHSLFLGSGIVQPRLRAYDEQRGLLPSEPASAASSTNDGVDKLHYIPSQAAIKHSLKYSIVELALSLFTFALFVNSAILITAGASLYNNPDAVGQEDIFAIHALLSQTISPAAGTIFALALLLSGVSAGIVCTIAGQMVSEGALNWKIRPWLRRLVTRSISITPSIVIAGAVGKEGLNAALTGSQVVLSSVLPFVTAPLIYFTCLNRYMTVEPGMARFRVDEEGEVALFARRRRRRGGAEGVGMANSWWLAVVAGVVWLIIAVMNVANLVLLGLGQG
ncbi:natural resistance-associated macrophage protein-domain-containing protein [Staphylotrichum tortipilum]|uniref:Natural resistance-associated macrophage protein-domain-containing protein n=1 Tax=Staphylotrichum tortipilum TaxID=2831512 RepID=A0AAN6RWA7_9PEZI|nr:natural resistance-associated macrophage protein-domain-containing protein [Staphylotrichum longicolle]